MYNSILRKKLFILIFMKKKIVYHPKLFCQLLDFLIACVVICPKNL